MYQYIHESLSDAKEYSSNIAEKNARNEFGQKTKKGINDYSDVDIPALMRKRSAQMEALLNLM